MTPAMEQELKRMRVEDDKWNGSKLLTVAAVTLACAFTVIYIISSMNSAAH